MWVSDAQARQYCGVEAPLDSDLAGILYPYFDSVASECRGARICPTSWQRLVDVSDRARHERFQRAALAAVDEYFVMVDTAKKKPL